MKQDGLHTFSALNNGLQGLKHRTLDGVQLKSLVEGESTSWQLIGIEGKWSGHWMGSFSLNKEIFKQIVDHFDGEKSDVVVDYEHGAVFGDRAPASGWAVALELRKAEDGSAQLWANINWTSAAAKHIRENEYRFLSPTFIWNTRDRKSGKMTGASLHSVALTNTPFLTELPEVQLNGLKLAFGAFQDQEINPMDEKQLAALREMLGLEKNAPVDVVLENAKLFVDGAALGTKLIGELNVAEDADEATILGAISVLKNPANDADEVATLRQQVAALTANEQARNAAGLVDSALKAGKLTAAGTDQYKWAAKFALENPQAFSEWMKSAPATVPVVTVVPSDRPAGVDASALTDLDRKCLKQMNLSDEDYVKYNEAQPMPTS